MTFTYVDSQRVIETVQEIRARIGDRFPDSGLERVCEQLLEISKDTDEILDWIKRPIFWLRWTVSIFIGIVIIFSVISLQSFNFQLSKMTLETFISITEAALNIIILVGGAILFLLSVENRLKRKRVIEAVNKLRSIAHLIDAHQLKKDPSILENKTIHTPHSPKRDYDPFLLSRYLDYCSEMLSLVGMISFLYVQHYQDSVAVKSVNDLENLCNGLSRKIWQKMIILRNQRLV